MAPMREDSQVLLKERFIVTPEIIKSQDEEKGKFKLLFQKSKYLKKTISVNLVGLNLRIFFLIQLKMKKRKY